MGVEAAAEGVLEVPPEGPEQSACEDGDGDEGFAGGATRARLTQWCVESGT